MVRMRCRSFRIEDFVAGRLVRSFLCECQTQLLEEIDPLLLRPRLTQPFPCPAGTSVRPVHKHIDEHVGRMFLPSQEVEQSIKYNLELVVLSVEDLAKGVDASVRARYISSFQREFVDSTEVDNSAIRIIALLVDWLSVEPDAPPVRRRVDQAYRDDNVLLASLSGVFDEVCDLPGVLAQEMFVYTGWECAVESTDGDDVRGQAVFVISACYRMLYK